MYGVFDQVGPQIFFANSRDEAVRQVARANEIVRLHPATVSVRHLREMDEAWRRANGLPALPEPEGRTVVVPAVVPASEGLADETLLDGRIAAVVNTAAHISAREALRSRVDAARDGLNRTRALDRELVRSWAACEQSMAQMRTALREIYGPHAAAAERELRAQLRSVESDHGAREHAAAAERFLARRRSRERELPSAAADAVVANARAVAEWDRAAAAAAAAVPVKPRPGATDRARYHQLLSELARSRSDGERALQEARAAYRSAASGPGPRLLGEQWRSLSPADRAAVLQVRPAVTELMRPMSVHGRETRARRSGGMSR